MLVSRGKGWRCGGRWIWWWGWRLWGGVERWGRGEGRGGDGMGVGVRVGGMLRVGGTLRVGVGGRLRVEVKVGVVELVTYPLSPRTILEPNRRHISCSTLRFLLDNSVI